MLTKKVPGINCHHGFRFAAVSKNMSKNAIEKTVYKQWENITVTITTTFEEDWVYENLQNLFDVYQL